MLRFVVFHQQHMKEVAVKVETYGSKSLKEGKEMSVMLLVVSWK